MLPLSEQAPWDLALAQRVGDRARQEDAADFRLSRDPLCCLLVVADGLGGHRGGREAAIAAVEALVSAWDQNPGVDENQLQSCMDEAARQVAKVSSESGLDARTTLVAVAFDRHSACWSHLGDSRLYRFRLDDTIDRTKDHSVARLMVEMGELTEEEALAGPEQGRLYKSLGPEVKQEHKIETASLTPEDGFLLCTDGFWVNVSEAEMAAALQEDGLDIALSHLAESAVRRSEGQSDNVTVCAARPRVLRNRDG